jgi:hypothetical protein
MPALAPGQTVVTSTPSFLVDPLPAGTYRFRLVVEDDSGNASAPVERVVTVVPLTRVEPVGVQPQPGVVRATPTVTATPVTLRVPLSTLSTLRMPRGDAP